MLNLLLAGVLLSGSVSQSVSHAQGHVSPMGGAVLGTATSVTRTIPSNIPRNAMQAAQGTQSIYRCSVKVNGRETQFTATDPRGCRFGLPYLWF
ncbi:MAG TPA: hypothetical protein VFL13_07050 [Candidatus Baltobacteraceae bacterium]|nr:hypothetical protein [Candidatus Baltobacteraceae bacterium]